MINNYDDFKECMRVGRPSNESRKKNELLRFKSAKPYTYGQYVKRYQAEEKEIADMKRH